MAVTPPIHAYRIRWRDPDTNIDREVHAAVDHEARRINVTAPGTEPFTVDVVTARAMSMILSDAIYRTLDPDGPTLTIEADTGQGFTNLRELA